MKKSRYGALATLADLVPGLLVLFSGIFSWPALAAPTTNSVDQNHPLASDLNPGTETLPWLTIAHAAQVAAAGDADLVKSGTYPERIQPPNSGVSGDPITFKASPRRTVTMFGFDTLGSDFLCLYEQYFLQHRIQRLVS